MLRAVPARTLAPDRDAPPQGGDDGVGLCLRDGAVLDERREHALEPASCALRLAVRRVGGAPTCRGWWGRSGAAAPPLPPVRTSPAPAPAVSPASPSAASPSCFFMRGSSFVVDVIVR